MPPRRRPTANANDSPAAPRARIGLRRGGNGRRGYGGAGPSSGGGAPCGMTFLNVLIALAIGAAIWTASMMVLRAVVNPPPELDPHDVVDTLRRFRCSLCGAEVTMTVANPAEPKAPRHCREEMDEVPAN